MKVTTPTVFRALALGALPFALAFQPASDKIDLTPRFKVDQVFTITQTVEMSGDIEDVSVTVDGTEMLEGGIEGGGEMTVAMTLVETVKELRDGKISKMTVSMEEGTMEASGSVNAMGESETMDESMDNPASGHVAEITIDEDGTIERKDITEDVEPLSSEELAQIPHRNHFDILLPTEPVEEGTPFELAPDWEELLGEAMASMEGAEMDETQMEAMQAMMSAFGDATEIEATGVVSKVEDGIATIDYKISATTAIDDLMELLKEAAPDELPDQLPPANASLELMIEMEGTGKFDLELGQLVSLELDGEANMDVNGDMNMGQEIIAAASMSGEFTIIATTEVE